MKRIASVVIALSLLGAACTDGAEERRPDPEPAPAETTEANEPEPDETEDEVAGRTIPIQVWFLSEQRNEPVLLLDHAEIPATQAIGRAAIAQLLLGVPGPLEEADPNAWTAINEDTELLGLTIEDGTATVDFNEEFGNTGLGTTYDGIQIDQVVWTLTQFPSVKRVEFLIDGEVPDEGIGGHGIIIDKPQTRKNNEHYLPPIVVENPYPGQELTPPFTMTGISNVFEATVSYRVKDEDGKVIKKGFTTATCGTGCYGTFSEVISLDVDLPAFVTLEVFESSAEDGSPLHMVRIPLNLEETS